MVLSLLAPFLGSAVSGLFGMAGANKSAKATARANAQNLAFQSAVNKTEQKATRQANRVARDQFKSSFNMAKSQFNRSMEMAGSQFNTQLAEAQKDRDLQREFAQNGVQWRVNDAKEAGLHPLAALGAQLASSSPIAISGNVPSGSVPGGTNMQTPDLAAMPVQADTSVGQSMANFGQDLSRAISAASTEWERQKEVANAASALQLENQALQNKLLASQVAKTRGAAIGPAMPSTRTTYMIAGQGNSPSSLVDRQKGKSTVVLPSKPHLEPFDFPDTGFSRTATGWAPQMSEIVKERTEDDILAEIPWHIRNRVLPQSLGGTGPPAHVKLPPGARWEWSHPGQEWRITHGAGRRSNIKVWLPNAE